MINTIQFQNKTYLELQTAGFAAKFTFPFALEICKGVGFDIGCNRKEWALPIAIPIDPLMGEFHAYKLPDMIVDFIFSSHCLEHLPNWCDALDFWTQRIKAGGVLFLYLPDRSQEYWLPFNNRKHIHYFDSEIIVKYLQNSGKYRKIMSSGVDLNNSFTVIAEKI
jgi:SAM-dependent methyltransferase